MVVHLAVTNIQVFCPSAIDHMSDVYYTLVGKLILNSDHTAEQKHNMLPFSQNGVCHQD